MVKYNKRSVPIVQGDTVKVVRGNFRNHVDKVRHVNLKRQHIEVEGVVTTKVDGSKVPRPIHPSNVIITKLNLTDPWRRERLERGLSEEVKREIEQEAQQQIEERQEAERREEEALAAKTDEELVEEAETVEGLEPEETELSDVDQPIAPTGEAPLTTESSEPLDEPRPEDVAPEATETEGDMSEPDTSRAEGAPAKRKPSSKNLKDKEVEK